MISTSLRLDVLRALLFERNEFEFILEYSLTENKIPKNELLAKPGNYILLTHFPTAKNKRVPAIKTTFPNFGQWISLKWNQRGFYGS